MLFTTVLNCAASQTIKERTCMELSTHFPGYSFWKHLKDLLMFTDRFGNYGIFHA